MDRSFIAGGDWGHMKVIDMRDGTFYLRLVNASSPASTFGVVVTDHGLTKLGQTLIDAGFWAGIAKEDAGLDKRQSHLPQKQ